MNLKNTQGGSLDEGRTGVSDDFKHVANIFRFISMFYSDDPRFNDAIYTVAARIFVQLAM